MNDDDKKMLEEVEKLDAEATRGPWRTHTDWPDKIMGPHGQIAECVGGNHDDDAIFVARARTLLLALAKRLREVLATDLEALNNVAAAGFEAARVIEAARAVRAKDAGLADALDAWDAFNTTPPDPPSAGKP